MKVGAASKDIQSKRIVFQTRETALQQCSRPSTSATLAKHRVMLLGSGRVHKPKISRNRLRFVLHLIGSIEALEVCPDGADRERHLVRDLFICQPGGGECKNFPLAVTNPQQTPPLPAPAHLWLNEFVNRDLRPTRSRIALSFLDRPRFGFRRTRRVVPMVG